MYEEEVNSRMELVQKMRSQSMENGYRIGRGCYNSPAFAEDEQDAGLRRSLARLKILAAVFLVAGIVFLDKCGGRFGALDADRIFQMIELDYEEVLTEKYAALIENCRR